MAKGGNNWRRFVPRAGTITIHQTEKGALSAGGSAPAGGALAAATASPAAATVLPTFDVSVTYTGTTTIVGGPPQAGGTTVIPTVIIPVSFVFDEYGDANGRPLVIDATPAVRQVVQSPIFQSHPFSTGYTQYGDAMQRAAFWSTMASNWHTLLGPPNVLPALDGNFYVPGTTDYHVAMTELLLQGFPVGHNPNHLFPPLAPEKVAIGTVATPLLRNFVSISGLSDALNYLIKGESYGGQYKLQNPAGYPNLLGMMTWSINDDQWSMNYEFSNTIGALLHDLPRTRPPSECPL